LAKRDNIKWPASELRKFRDLPGYKGRYIINREGQIRSLYFKKILNHTIDRRGNVRIHLNTGKETRRAFTVASLVAAAFLGKRPKGAMVNFKDGNRFNVSAGNLFYQDGPNKGEKHPQHKLSNRKVRTIRRSNLPNVYWAKRYQVTPMCISQARRRIRWAHI